MLDRSLAIELGGKKFRLWYGFRAQRRLGCKAALDLARMVAGMEVAATDGRLIDINLDDLISLLWGGLHQTKPDANGRLVHVGMAKDEVEELLSEQIEAADASQSEVIGDVARSVVKAVELANVFRVSREERVAESEAGEAPANPTATSLSAPSSSPPLASV